MTRACQGVVFVSVDLVKKLMEKTTTKTGLWVTVDIIAATYPTGVKAPGDFKKTMAIVFDDLLPKWNYRALPQKRRGNLECLDRFCASGQLWLAIDASTSEQTHGRQASQAISQ